MKNDITIIIADDHPVFRRGLKMIIEADARLKVAAEAADGAEALELIKKLAPDVAVLDVNMPHLNGFEVVRELKNFNLATEYIFLTMHKDETMFNTAIDLGARGYLLKESAVDDIVAGIKAAASGEHFISSPLTNFLVKRSARREAENDKRLPINDLTDAERRIIQLVAEDKTSREIGELLFISVRTVERHRQNICNKLGVHGSNGLLKFAVANKNNLR